MKKGYAVTVSRRLSLRLSLAFMAVVFAVSTTVSPLQTAYADRWDDQMNALRAKAQEYQAQADQLRAQGDTLQNRLNEITAKVQALQAEIDVNKTKQAQLEAAISENQTKLSNSQDALGEVLANLYVDGEITSFEMLASSENIGDFVDKQEYRSAVKEQLNSLISEVKKIKAQLESDKKEVDKILAELDRQNQQMVAQQAEQQSLVDQTRGEEAAYQQLVGNARAQMASVAAQQQAYYASLGGNTNGGTVGSFTYWGWSGNKGCTGGYPYCAGPLDYAVDPWNLYTRECVSYVAWALEARFGKNVQPFHGDGNAYQWPSSAARWSGAWRTYDPQPGDVVVLPQSGAFAPVGHVMIVESVSGDNVFVSQYNFYGTGQYSTMWIKTSGVIFLRFP